MPRGGSCSPTGSSTPPPSSPTCSIDVATLTGAARTALGERYIPVMGDEQLARADHRGRAPSVGETFWYMPMPPELRSLLDSDIADIANGRPAQPVGGMLVAAHFLQALRRRSRRGDGARSRGRTSTSPGPANNSGGGWGMTPKGATGVTVRTLIALAEVLSRP